MPPRYHIETWGCQMNVHDSEKLAGLLEREGYRRAQSANDADVILLNTCAVRDKAEEKVFSELGRLAPRKQLRPELRIGVCGCVAQQVGKRIFDRAPYVDFVVGPGATAALPSAILRSRAGERRIHDLEQRADSVRFRFDDIRRTGTHAAKAFVTIIEGCNHRCTFCVVPNTRGRERCRPLEEVLAELRFLAARGVIEVEFLGQTVNAYRDEGRRTLADLLRHATEIPALRRIRFTTSHPAQMTPRLIESMAECRPVVCPYLHLPVQSGSDRVLRRMRRGYDHRGYLRTIDALRSRIPGLCLGTDVIVGFPGETPEDFAATLHLLREVSFDTVFSFAYSSRPGTMAQEFGDPVPEEEKKERLAQLQDCQREIQTRTCADWMGREVEVLVEGPSKHDPGQMTGRTPENRIVHFSGPAETGCLKRLKVVRATPYWLRGAPMAGAPA